MPELPEVETIKRGLRNLVINKRVSKVERLNYGSFLCSDSDLNNFLIGSNIIDVRRRAKVLMIDLSSEYTLVIHLKMTGQLVYRGETSFGAGHPTDSLIGTLPDRSTRVIFSFSDGSRVFFNDQRKFGWVKLLPTNEVYDLDFFKKVGPEPLEDDFSFEVFKSRFLKRKNTTIKSALLDQTVIAGVGNIYADESLWGARIHPKSLVRDVSQAELKALYNEVRSVMLLAIEKGGSTDRNYINPKGEKGNYLNFARVFRREGQACPRCNDIIDKIRVAGRGTHLCSKCQKEDK